LYFFIDNPTIFCYINQGKFVAEKLKRSHIHDGCLVIGGIKSEVFVDSVAWLSAFSARYGKRRKSFQAQAKGPG
jgi:hypothetical protein